MRHELKTIQPYFNDVNYGEKNFEVRKNDRDFRVGDTLELIEYDPKTDTTGKRLVVKVSYVLKGGQFGI